MERIASREIYWNIPEHLLLYVLLLPFLAVFLYGCYRRFGALLLGRKGVRLGQPKERLKAFVSQAVLQGRIATERYSGVMHLSLSWGFLVLFIATTLVAFQDYFGLRVLRRFRRPPARLVEPRHADGFGWLLLLFLAVLVTGFLVEGLRIMATADPRGPWSAGGGSAPVLIRV